jgi:CubicO group peptidase (beta-lactamase class C family)
VLKPCGIKEAYFKRDDAVKARMAAQYEYKTGITDHVIAQQTARCGDGVLVNVGKDIDFAMWSEYESGGAGLVLSVPEYAKFADALACGGRTSVGERILSDGTVDLLRTNQLTEKMMPSFKWVQMKGYGYGLGVRTLIDRAAAGFCGKSGEFGWGGAAGATLLSDHDTGFSYCYAHHMLNPQEAYYQPRLRNVAYACFMR